MTTGTETRRADWRTWAVVALVAVFTITLGLIFPIGGGLVVSLLAAFTILRHRAPVARWWLVGLGALLSLVGFYLLSAESTLTVW